MENCQLVCKYRGSPIVSKFGTFQGIHHYWCNNCRRESVSATMPKMKTNRNIISAALGRYFGAIPLPCQPLATPAAKRTATQFSFLSAPRSGTPSGFAVGLRTVPAGRSAPGPKGWPRKLGRRLQKAAMARRQSPYPHNPVQNLIAASCPPAIVIKSREYDCCNHNTYYHYLNYRTRHSSVVKK